MTPSLSGATGSGGFPGFIQVDAIDAPALASEDADLMNAIWGNTATDDQCRQWITKPYAVKTLYVPRTAGNAPDANATGATEEFTSSDNDSLYIGAFRIYDGLQTQGDSPLDSPDFFGGYSQDAAPQGPSIGAWYGSNNFTTALAFDNQGAWLCFWVAAARSDPDTSVLGPPEHAVQLRRLTFCVDTPLPVGPPAPAPAPAP